MLESLLKHHAAAVLIEREAIGLVEMNLPQSVTASGPFIGWLIQLVSYFDGCDFLDVTGPVFFSRPLLRRKKLSASRLASSLFRYFLSLRLFWFVAMYRVWSGST